MFRKWEVPLKMEKRQYSSCLKKNKKQELKNYRPISLLPVSGKIFQRLLYGSMFTFFTENNLISQNHSGFKPGNSSTNQLLAITHKIYKSFDEGHEVRYVFLKISNVFEKVLHKGLIFKLKPDSRLPKKKKIIYFNENLLKIMKNSFYFILKPLFVLKIFKF